MLYFQLPNLDSVLMPSHRRRLLLLMPHITHIVSLDDILAILQTSTAVPHTNQFYELKQSLNIYLDKLTNGLLCKAGSTTPTHPTTIPHIKFSPNCAMASQVRTTKSCDHPVYTSQGAAYRSTRIFSLGRAPPPQHSGPRPLFS